MRTRELFRYLVAMIIALSTTVNAMAQQRNLKIYFNANNGTSSSPVKLVTDDNNAYDLPAGVEVSYEGVVWANKARYWEMFQQDVTDRLVAAYEKDRNGNENKKESHLKLSFTNFPYEVNMIQWNIMNDLLSASILNILDNYRVTTKCVPQSGNGFSYTDEHWDMNFFAKNITFTQRNVPWQSGAVLKGLTSFEIGEQSWKKSPLGILLNKQTEINDKCRTFIKAGWNGQSGSNSNIDDNDDNNWAFKVKFTLPDLRMRSYKCTVANNIVTLGELDNNIIKGESGKHALRGYIADHAGNVVPMEAPTDPDDIDPDAFHYKYEADETKINIHPYTGVIYEAKVAGDITVTVKLMRGTREVCSYPQTIHVYSDDPTRSEIAIGFLNGNKGYDVTVGDQNAQIQGIITKYGENITLSNGTSGYHFEYSEDSNGEIIDIDPLTGKITAKKEGDVVVSAVLKNGGTIRSNTYTYSLHVFAQHEGMDWKLEKTYTYTNNSNKNDWKISENTNSLSNKWESKDLLMVNTTINGSSDWKQIACFTTPASPNWRGICQTIQFDLRIPKYTKITGTYPLAGNLNIGSSKGPIKYGFESKDLGAVDAATADTNVKDITWLTQGSHDATHASTNKYSTQIIADATSYNNGNIGNEKDYRRSLDNLTSEHVTKTRYLAIMAYLHKDNSYPGDASFGFKNIPTYEYYSTVTYYKNDGTSNVWRTQNFTSTSKTDVMPMYNGSQNLPTRAGYEFLGWSTDPNATTAEYPGKGGDFCPYDDVNGGGKGPVDLYAVWRAIPYIVTLNHNYSPYETEEIVAYYGQPMPEDESIVAPTRTGYDFTGYKTQKDITPQVFYYDAEMKSAHIYDKTSDYTIFANWEAHTTKITFDFQGGNGSTTEVTATYGEAMPTATAPSRTGYTFAGYYYYSEANGQGTKYYNADMTSVRTWNVDEPEVTLHAVWNAIPYTVTLNHNYSPYETEEIVAYYGQPMPEDESIVAPTRTGYDFTGYRTQKDITPQVFYYNAEMKSAHIYDKTSNYTIFANWEAHTTTVVFDLQGGILYYGATEVNATYGKDMPTEGVGVPQRQGYTFGGYYNKPNGAGTQYYTASMTSARTWNIDERLLNPQVTKVTLYANWIPLTYTVTLDRQGGIGGSTSVTAAYGQPLPSGLTAPTKPGYEFRGYYSNQNQEYAESMGQDYGGTQYYDKDMVSIEPWDKTEAATIYAHWAPATFIVTFNGTNGAIVPKQMQYYSQKPISDVIYNSDGVMKISFKYGGQCPSQITNGKFKKAGFKLLGFYDSNNVLVATVNVDHPEDRNIYFNESSGYWTRKDGNLVWNCTHDVNLTARYEPKYTVRDGDIIDFGTEYLEVGIDWENSMVHDLLGAAEAEKEAGRISSTNPVMVFDIRNARYLDNSSKKSDDLMVPLRDKDFISPNLLVYLGEGAYDVIENEIETDGNCPGLVVTDRYPIKIPYAFKAGKALYERNKVQKDNNDLDDAMWKQSHESIWGTLCLPYPIKNNNTYNDVSKVIFYELRKKSGSVMQFKKLPENAEIPANTPVLYERTVGIGSAVTIEENAENIYNKNTWISVPKNQSYEAEVTSYANATEPSIRDWEFRGNLKTNVFCGKGYINPPAAAIANSDITNNGEVYYFKQNKFTRLTPSMEKNGVHYDAGMMTIYPYRAYFYQKGSSGSSAKVSAYSILVVDEFGNTTDITNAVFGDGEGDGKIYDLNGIRVMQPVKGRLYIVNGQKKVYR